MVDNGEEEEAGEVGGVTIRLSKRKLLTVGGLCAPCNALAFNITNKTVRFRRTPKTEI
jgi:hypothetical protein